MRPCLCKNKNSHPSFFIDGTETALEFSRAVLHFIADGHNASFHKCGWFALPRAEFTPARATEAIPGDGPRTALVAVDFLLRFIRLGACAFTASFSRVGGVRYIRLQGSTIQDQHKTDHSDPDPADNPWKIVHRSTAQRILAQWLRRLHLADRVWRSKRLCVSSIFQLHLIRMSHLQAVFVNGSNEELTILRSRKGVGGIDHDLTAIDGNA